MAASAAETWGPLRAPVKADDPIEERVCENAAFVYRIADRSQNPVCVAREGPEGCLMANSRHIGPGPG